VARRRSLPTTIAALVAGALLGLGGARVASQARADDRVDPAPATASRDEKSDVEITGEIRRAVLQDRSLSTYGHNITILVEGGVVTLKGPVRSDLERQLLVGKAALVVGEDRVRDHLEIASP
jgi:osmotically-inducible protein OsmY